ncbi:MAG: acetyl-CoA carboxylase biotin carboxyl carrier protein [Weeksellaceae bacterium]
MDIKEIQNLIRFVSKSGVAEVNLKTKDIEIKIKNISGEKPGIAPPVIVSQPVPSAPQIVATAPQQPQTETNALENTENSDYIVIKSPMIGTFYRSSGPDKEPYVSVGDSVAPGTVICIVEAMKLFNEIESEVAGKVVKILVEDSTPVEYDQPLFLIEPL